MSRVNDERTGQFQMATSLLVTGALGYLYDTVITNSNLNEHKKMKVVFLLLTMFVFVNVTIWLNGVRPIDLNVAAGNAGDASAKSALVTEGIPFLTDGRPHYLNSGGIIYREDSGTDGTVVGDSERRLLAASDNADAEGEPLNDAFRHMYHLIASALGAGILTGLYTFAKSNSR